MKKVYLVYATLFYEDGSHLVYLLNAFASSFKAHVYLNYKRLSIERFGADHVFGKGVDHAVIRLICQPVCSIDYSHELNMLQDEKL